MSFVSRRKLLIALNIILAIPLAIYAFATIYTRFMGDDFCAYDKVPTWGTFNYTLWTYMTWSGRVATNFSFALLRFIPSQAEPLMAVLFLILWWVALFILARLILSRREIPNVNLSAALIATLLLLTVLTGAANVMHTVYWQSAIATFLMPLVLITFFAWVVLQDRLGAPISLVLCEVLALVAGLYSEVYALLQTILIAAAYVVYMRQRPQFWRLLVGFTASFIALVLVVAAPGNADRQASSYPPPNIVATVKGTLTSPAIPIIISVTFSPFNCLAVFCLPVLIAYYDDRRTAKQARFYMLMVLLTILAGSAATFAVAYYATSNVLPARALTEPQYIMLVGVAVVGYLFGLSIKRVRANKAMPRWIAASVLMVLVIAGISSSLQALATMQQLRNFAQAWDLRDAQIKAFRAAHPDSTEPVNVLFIPNRFDVDEIGSDTNGWVNQCAASFYHVAAIVSTPAQ